MCPVERERGPPGCRASGLTPELPVHVVLVPLLLVPPAVVGSAVVGSAAASFSSAGTPRDGTTSTASRLLFSGLPSEVSSSPAVVVTKKAPDFTRAGVTGQE